MNFREFATKNVHRNAKAYFAYFLSSSISAALLFSFTMIIFHPDFVVLKLPQYLKNTFNMTTVIAYLFLCFFVFYSVSVFLKSRYKEFGILYTLGSSKKQIQRMISIENIIISSVSAIVGIIIGVVFSKILLAASGKLLGYNVLGFYLPIKAMLITFIAFVMIGIVNSALCSFIIKEDKVLSLLKGTKKPRPEPKSSVILVIICIGLLTIGYYLSITASMKTITYRIIPVTIMVIAATYFLFSQLSVFVIKLLKKNRNLYMKKTTLLWVSNLLYRIKNNTRMFFLITITSTVALTSIGAVYAYWRDKEIHINRDFPQAFFCSNRENNKTRADFIESSLKKEGVDYTKVRDEMKIVIPEGDKDEVIVIKENVYKQLASTLSLDTIIFNKNETVVAAPLVGYERRKIILDNIKLDVIGKSDKRVIPTLYGDIYVIKDNVYEKIKGGKIYFWAFNVKNYKDTLSICKSYYNNFEIDSKGTQNISLLKAHILESTKIAYGVILFSTIFIGLIFFVTTGSFLYNKCYMDILEDKKKYKQLNKIGLTYKEIKKVLTIEIGILFLFPYIIAVVHSFFALSALKYAYAIEITVAAFVVMGSMMFVQIIYFIIIRKTYLIEIKKSLL
ncbi:peptide ABC transporter permease [Clostridium pasteurianum DSM 525 = ATCC 6013]|uniref:Peptide ABC transporter permease n=1 Tax=Clostridium pasteurianum DSM 525 = ATCC 6013 TaxID=1262449 RepID=A0A0H3J2N9_CLOPA|nr:ABC transporter permease [Clostridium pasteurianum]AJA47082.1 peptide ABC transporter permease [Clostridium pasteurianum DSM 525 = ATCC 6013]AJA51070.1 peptide ABC transporter permease [Clostridium pasteurianum DSM 525 = ATCC 6013]AOZ74445.1 ABC transporter permease [Clostridium pasteurianum DSM 525 = ATCC 6013]AOZ78242.1 ABC transporter permease [Clostridium pasteurianum]ELP59530.1 peptide ABC transporter permease [Clostridium pasteurianum DSM 525 = ATCC 6013]